jgi:uncharacterized membrane protein YobD (UPF0266 family)
MSKGLNEEKSMAFSYLELRKIIGVLGTAFPFILSIGALILFRTGIQSSISSYYHTGMRNVFVGTLCVIGFFLFSYKGHRKPGDKDNLAGNLGCIFAVGVALFPTTPDVGAASTARLIGYVHFAFAALFFLTLIYFSFFLFTKTHADKTPTRRKLYRNKIYKACGITMFVCIVLIFIYKVLPDSFSFVFAPYKPVYWLEALAVFSFGISWLTKGEAIMKDED